MYFLHLGLVFWGSKLDLFVLMSMSAGLLWTRDLGNERRPQTLYGMVWYLDQTGLAGTHPVQNVNRGGPS